MSSLLSSSNHQDDRFIISLLLAAALHALLILGVGFSPPEVKPVDETLTTLDIAIVPKRKTPPPEEADYLAATSQDGGGNMSERVTPTTPQPASVVNTPHSAIEPQPTPQELSVQKAERKAQVSKPEAMRDKQVTAAELINRSMEMISLDEQLRQSSQAYSKRPRPSFITPSTREFKYANYMNDWIAKVERIGNLNYPDEARRKDLSGSLLLDVALNQDGTIQNITLLRPSGHKALDDAAIRIVQLAAPFPPLPEDIRKDTDILHITRTWEFLNSYQLQSH
jgi:protein TonB